MQRAKALKRFCAWMLATATIATSIVPSGMAYASTDSGGSGTYTESTVSGNEEDTGKVLLKINGEGGKVTVSSNDAGKQAVTSDVDEDGNQTITVKDATKKKAKGVTTIIDDNEEDTYALELEEPVDSTVSAKVRADDGYIISDFKVLDEDGNEIDEQEEVKAGTYKLTREVVVTEDTQVIEVSFEYAPGGDVSDIVSSNDDTLVISLDTDDEDEQEIEELVQITQDDADNTEVPEEITSDQEETKVEDSTSNTDESSIEETVNEDGEVVKEVDIDRIDEYSEDEKSLIEKIQEFESVQLEDELGEEKAGEMMEDFGDGIELVEAEDGSVYAQAKAGAVGTRTVSQVLDFDDNYFYKWLAARDGTSDNAAMNTYYLTTPYSLNYPSALTGKGTNNGNPNGDPGHKTLGGWLSDDTYGTPQMNCTGFVWHVLFKSTYNSGTTRGAQSLTGIIPQIQGWVSFYKSYSISYQYFDSKEELLANARLEKGDIIWSFQNKSDTSLDSDHHIGFYWGDDKNPDMYWHSAPALENDKVIRGNASGNRIGKLIPKAPGNILWVYIKTTVTIDDDDDDDGEEDATGRFRIWKKSNNEDITDGNACYAFTGAKFGVYEDKNCTKLIQTLTTKNNGKTPKSDAIDIPDGKDSVTVYVKEEKAPKGYQLNEKVFSVEIQTGTTDVEWLEVKDVPEGDPGNIIITKKDNGTGTTGSQFKGAEYTLYHFPISNARVQYALKS